MFVKSERQQRSIIIMSVRVLKLHVTRWIKYYNGPRKLLYAKPIYALGKVCDLRFRK